jgi:hypothetical protein
LVRQTPSTLFDFDFLLLSLVSNIFDRRSVLAMDEVTSSLNFFSSLIMAEKWGGLGGAISMLMVFVVVTVGGQSFLCAQKLGDSQ